jgi:hypothetical protein
MVEYRNKWLHPGFEPGVIDKPRIESQLAAINRAFHGSARLKTEWCVSPLELRNKMAGYRQTLRAAPFSPVFDVIRNDLWDKLENHVAGDIVGLVEEQIRISLFALWGMSAVRRVQRHLNRSTARPAKSYGTDPHSTAVGEIAFYLYFLRELSVEDVREILPFAEVQEASTWQRFAGDTIFLTEKPVTFNFTCAPGANGQVLCPVLHCDNGPALRYSDDFSIWALNGRIVPRKIVETPWDQLDARLILKERNAETRLEIVRKMGIERVCSKLNAKCIDQQGEYELLLLNLAKDGERPYLKMLNPSTGTYHIEGVIPGLKTVKEALVWRNGTAEVPKVLT